MSNRTGVAVFELRYDYLCHMANPADDTLAELARIVGSGATLSPSSFRSDAADRPQRAEDVRAPAAPPEPVAPVRVERSPTMMMNVNDAPVDHGSAPRSDLPTWAQATAETAPRFDFDLHDRLQAAFGNRVGTDKSAFERVVNDEAVPAAPVARPEAVTDLPTAAAHNSPLNAADELDAALSAELDRVLADEMAEGDAEFASPELKSQDDFETELARMFLPDPQPEPASAQAERSTHSAAGIASDAFSPEETVPQQRAANEAPIEPMLPVPERQAPVVVDPVFAEGDMAYAAPVDDTAGPSRGRGKTIALAIAGIALLGGTAAVALNFLGGENGPPPIILADNSPAKEKPADPGGENVPNQDQAVYRSVEGRSNGDIEQPTLLESEETPIQVTNVDIADGGGANALAPRTVRTVTVRPDGTIVGSTNAGTAPRSVRVTTLSDNRFEVGENSAAANPIGPEATPPVAASPASEPAPAPVVVAAAEPEVATPEPVVVASEPVAPAPVVPTPAPKPVEVAKVEPTPEPEPAPAPTPAAASPYKVQISSQRSDAAARSSYDNLSRRYASVIGGKGVDYQRTDIPGKGIYYRVRIPAASRSEANTICSRLKSAGGSCFVTR